MQNGQLVELTSWQIVKELRRRHPSALRIIETHPGGGQYDCLSLVSRNGDHIAALNRLGSFTVFQTFDGSEPQSIPSAELWEDALSRFDLISLVDRMSALLGLSIPKPLPPTDAETLVYRLTAAFLLHSMSSKHRWECRSGYEDTSGFGGGVRSYFEHFPTAAARLSVHLSDDIFGNPAYRFWFLLQNGSPVLCLETTGEVHTRSGVVVPLLPLYRKHQRMWPIIVLIGGEWLP